MDSLVAGLTSEGGLQLRLDSRLLGVPAFLLLVPSLHNLLGPSRELRYGPEVLLARGLDLLHGLLHPLLVSILLDGSRKMGVLLVFLSYNDPTVHALAAVRSFFIAHRVYLFGSYSGYRWSGAVVVHLILAREDGRRKLGWRRGTLHIDSHACLVYISEV